MFKYLSLQIFFNPVRANISTANTRKLQPVKAAGHGSLIASPGTVGDRWQMAYLMFSNAVDIQNGAGRKLSGR